MRYVATAAHVLIGMHDAGIPAPFLRFNRTDGGAQWVKTAYEEWAYESASDTAILRFEPPEMLETVSLGASIALNEDRITDNAVGPGDDLFMPGLFLMFNDPSRIYGTDKNVPIIRSGHIASMPGEPVKTKVGMLDAYLVEARSIGGLSGSPVFVHLGAMRIKDGKVENAQVPGPGISSGIFYLLGFVHGHFPVIGDAEVDSSDVAGISRQDVNMGIAIVVPIQHVLELIDRPDVRKPREQELADWWASHGGVNEASSADALS